ncbi:FecR domain-containing protein [Thermodesulfobacteriota bacterium]
MIFRLSTILSMVIIVISAMIITVPSRAEEASVGTVTESKGTVTITRSDGREVDAQKDLSLFPGDTITTGKDGTVSFVFHVGDSFKLNEDSQVSLDELSVSEEDTPPVLRLALGFLWSKIKPYLSKDTRQVIHTPTAVLGIRGTEFDAVVSEDSAFVVTVDEGSVELEAEKAKRVVEQGQSTEVDPEEKILPATKATPREKRNWQKFRKERAEKLLKHLPQKAPRMRKRFERDVNRYLRFTQKINTTADRINDHISQFNAARKNGDRRTAQTQLKEIQSQEKKFRPMALQFRKASNRVRVIGRSTFHINRMFLKNRARFSSADLAVIEPNLSAVSEKLKELKRTAKATVTKIRQTYRDLKRLRQSINKQQREKKRRKRTTRSSPDVQPVMSPGFYEISGLEVFI